MLPSIPAGPVEFVGNYKQEGSHRQTSTQTLISVALVNRALARLIQPEIYRRIRLEDDGRAAERLSLLMRAFADQPEMSHHV